MILSISIISFKRFSILLIFIELSPSLIAFDGFGCDSINNASIPIATAAFAKGEINLLSPLETPLFAPGFCTE